MAREVDAEGEDQQAAGPDIAARSSQADELVRRGKDRNPLPVGGSHHVQHPVRINDNAKKTANRTMSNRTYRLYASFVRAKPVFNTGDCEHGISSI
jgi:hypothetical protein